MRSFTLVSTVVVLALASVTAPVAAAPADTPANSTAQRPAERIGPNTLLISSSYDEQNGTASVVIESERPQTITVSDAGAFSKGGEIPRRITVFGSGERRTIELPATKINGKIGLAISTDETLYAEVISVAEPDDSLFQGRPTWQDMQVAGLSGFVGGLLIVSLVAWHRVKSDQGEVERVL